MSSGVEELEGTVGGNIEQSTAVKAIVDFYGPSELQVMAETQDRFNRAHDFESGQLRSASPLVHLTKDDPPLLILHGDNDKTVPVSQSTLLHERYQKVGLDSELHILKGAGHGGMAFSDENRFLIIKRFLDHHLIDQNM